MSKKSVRQEIKEHYLCENARGKIVIKTLIGEEGNPDLGEWTVKTSREFPTREMAEHHRDTYMDEPGSTA